MAKLSQLRAWFNEFNDKHFGGILKTIPIRITRSKRYFGHYSDPPAIFIGRHLNKSSDDFRDTLLHEMIHYYIEQVGIVEDDDHGPIFQEMHLKLLGKEYVDLD